jgi:hypothetical protein
VSAARFRILLDGLQQVAEVALAHTQRKQLLHEANELYRTAIKSREDHTAFLHELEERLVGLRAESRQRFVMTVHTMLRDQVAFGDACLVILGAVDENRRR